MELLVEASFTPLEAIHIATSNGAEFLGGLDKVGTLAPGKAADIVVLPADPSANACRCSCAVEQVAEGVVVVSVSDVI